MIKDKQTFIPIHPGIALKEDFLDDLNIKPGTLARAIDVDRTAIAKIIKGKRSITAEMSLRLGMFFGMSDQFWLNMQTRYDMVTASQAKKNDFSDRIIPMKDLQTV